MFIAHEHLLIALAILLALALIGMVYSAQAGADSKKRQLIQELDFARRTGTVFRYRFEADTPVQRVYLLTQVEIDNLGVLPNKE